MSELIDNFLKSKICFNDEYDIKTVKNIINSYENPELLIKIANNCCHGKLLYSIAKFEPHMSKSYDIIEHVLKNKILNFVRKQPRGDPFYKK